MRDKPYDPEDERLNPDAAAQVVLSRRDFLRLNLALIALAGMPACTGPEIRPDTRRTIHLLRAEDLLSLHVELGNLEIVERRNKGAMLRRVNAGREAFLAVRFPGQHLAEEAFGSPAAEWPAALPAQARMARPTQLVFRLPPEVDAIDLTLEALLDWQRFQLQTAPLEQDPSHQGIHQSTRIELPTGLVLRPEDNVSWRHAVHPVKYNGRVELWHTRMLGGTPGSTPLVRIQSPGYEQKDLFDTSLQQADRRRLLGKQAAARTLILSPMGGWLEIRGRWKPEAAGDITRWEHRVTAGQDQKVVLEYDDGFLYPFGHRATLLRVTERLVETHADGHTAGTRSTAVLRKRDFIVVKTPTVSYRHGEMACERIHIVTTVTPALSIASAPADTAPPFWVETAPGKPFLFQARADDWGQHQLTFEAAAVFVPANFDLAVVDQLYTRPEYQRFRQIALQGQAATVARFEPALPSADADPRREEKPARTPGDTTLHLLLLELSAKADDSGGDSAPFACETLAMLARLPALEPYLDETRNRGWFSLHDPDGLGNVGEVFAKALPDKDALPRIPLYFDEQADLSGGLTAPSFDVDGISRVFGPVGQAELVANGKTLSAANYFAPGKSHLLGGFPLADLLSLEGSERSPAIPRIELILGRKQPKKKPEPDTRSGAGRSSDPDPWPVAGNKDDKPAFWEAGIGLSWKIPLDPRQPEKLPLIGFEVERDAKGKSRCALQIAVKATRRLGGQPATNPDRTTSDESARGTATTGGAKDSGASGVKLSASGRISNFSLALQPSATDSLRIVFDRIEVKLGPPKSPEDEDQGSAADDPTPTDSTGEPDESNNDAKKTNRSIEPEIEVELGRIEAAGALRLIQAVIAAATQMPLPPKREDSEDSGFYPAKLPGSDAADLGVTLGPFEAPKFRLLHFDVTNVSATFGIGLYFFPRPVAGSNTQRVPDCDFALRVASAKKPLTLLSAPWGGIAHLGLNFTTKQLTAFQFSMGVIYRAEFQLVGNKAQCEGSLATMFTYSAKGDPRYQLDFIIRLSGQGKLWFFDIYLLLVVIGSWADHVWSFDATLEIRLHVGFFAVTSSFGFHYTIADHREHGDLADRATPSEGTEAQMIEGDWLAYRRAFAGMTRS